VDDLIDVIEGNRRYVKCLYVYNKVTWCSCGALLHAPARQALLPVCMARTDCQSPVVVRLLQWLPIVRGVWLCMLVPCCADRHVQYGGGG
jgi:ribosome-interacting GTPase 1